MPEPQIPQGFRALNLPPSLFDRLNKLGFVTPTPIQSAAIPPALDGRDVVGIAQTGTGKTLAFGLPMAARLKTFQIGLVLAPTRELAQQIEETLKSLGLKTALLIGGAPIGRQVMQLRGRPQVIVATPGRLEDHLSQKSMDLRNASIIVLDEADRMLDMGFAPAIKRILAQAPTARQTMMFSATMPREIRDLADNYLKSPHQIEIEPSGTAATGVHQELFVVMREDKTALLKDLLAEHTGTVLVFARTRYGAQKLTRHVRAMGHAVAEIHSDRTLAQRRAALDGFKSGQYRVLIATDIAARGIDVKDISLVVNYDVPENPEDYVHRIGRTGRAGASGRAITMATPEQHRDVRDIEKLLKSELQMSSRSVLTIERPRAAAPRPPSSRPKHKTWGPNRASRPRR